MTDCIFEYCIDTLYCSDVYILQWTDWEAADRTLEIDRSVPEVDWATSGMKGGLKVLEEFVKYRLPSYKADRNIPTKDAVSHLSPWFHFGKFYVVIIYA